MITQVIFKIDKKLKDQAMKRAKAEGIPFASVLKLATKAYASGSFAVTLSPEEKFNARTRSLLLRELKEIQAGKNISPRFTNTKDAIAFLKQS